MPAVNSLSFRALKRQLCLLWKSDFPSLPDEIFRGVCYPYVCLKPLFVTNIWKQFSEIISRYKYVKLNEKKKINEPHIPYSLPQKRYSCLEKKEVAFLPYSEVFDTW